MKKKSIKNKRRDTHNTIWYGRGRRKGCGIPQELLRYYVNKPFRQLGRKYCYECLYGEDIDCSYENAINTPYKNFKWYIH